MQSKSPSARRCCLCLEEQPLTPRYFERSKNKSGFNYRCKMCETVWNALRYRERRIDSAARRVPKLADVERRAIERALMTCNGDVGTTAKLLGIGRATLHRKMSEWGSKSSDYRNPDIEEFAKLKQQWKDLHDLREIKRVQQQQVKDRKLLKELRSFLPSR